MPEIAEIFRDHHKEYFRRNNAPPEVIRTIFDIEKCCTPAMGQCFLAILRDIKKDMDSGEQPVEAVTAAMFQTMRDALAQQKQEPLSMDDVTAMIAGQIGQILPMDEEATKQFQALAKKMMEQAGGAQNEEEP